ncbi:uncharacterized protein SEPMUDRAFT_116079 [Sphaerulina musiva SO2202]|uniref:Uncharacterized protein n=1 Tax=Sphaerulina musiva (strain SO2202) TaxID=692275 RepID=M3C3H5_SPHMS|nr:uncharacterized protein SEPMUDRAFT_116079 [Sphaerulina musiva SO2202]EMF14821.1 hypothetical protein SEPMUDRAFT_116079 [Sphaerulina musiva SO2202]
MSASEKLRSLSGGWEIGEKEEEAEVEDVSTGSFSRFSVGDGLGNQECWSSRACKVVSYLSSRLGFPELDEDEVQRREMFSARLKAFEIDVSKGIWSHAGFVIALDLLSSEHFMIATRTDFSRVC